MLKKKTPKKTETALAVKPEREMTPPNMIALALAKDSSPETIEKLMNLQERWEAGRARKAYTEAMAKFQALCPAIKKDKSVFNKPDKGGALRYKFAPLDSIVAQVKKILQECGFSYTTDAVIQGNFVTATCRVTHILGHSETSSFQVPIDADAYMTSQQKFGAALTFAKRYAFVNAFGIMTGDEDVDANAIAPTAPASKDEKIKQDFIAKLVSKKDVKGLEEARDQINESDKLTNQEKMRWMGLINDHLKALKK